MEQKRVIVKILLSSRETVFEMREVYDKCFSVLLLRFSESRVFPDISLLVRDSVETKFRASEAGWSESLIDEIISTLAKGARGMFLWVSFQLHDIFQAMSKEDIRTLLRKLPKYLEETYRRILKKIDALS
ncbi:hypothetical protein BDD12DRAFT_368842 [Trichophaea hybrida]|nr:hypothetical protein BDD12DRAFT_368842 [Trichophaea hybrida]